jgi:tRNA nucleotidyltransferase (CCA-adding enzyme)
LILHPVDGVKIYTVGGAVRDELLGLALKDRDYVVVGATPQQMLARGFRAVGKDFPVFLHPQTREEYALARTERKTAPGYRGFVFHAAPDVTLEQDLVRRDLTINAIAKAEDGTLSDPFGGLRDIEQRVLRHVSDAFREDPVRILRVARFAARFTDFVVAPETMGMMQRMVHDGEVDALVPERVWQEVARGLMEERPSRMLDVLRECGALLRIMPELDALWQAAPPDSGSHTMDVIDRAAGQGATLAVRFAVLVHDLGSGNDRDVAPIESMCRRSRVPNDCRDLAIMTAREQAHIGRIPDADAAVTLFERCDAFRKPERYRQMLEAIALCCRHVSGPLPAAILWWQAALAAARGVDAGLIALGLTQSMERLSSQCIPAAIHAARAVAVETVSAAVAERANGG